MSSNNENPTARVSQQSFLNSANDSGARKFITPDAVQNNSIADATNNNEQIVDLASGLKAASISMKSIANRALANAQQVVEELKRVSGSVDMLVTQQLREYNDVDVINNQDALHRDVISDFSGITDQNVRTKLEESSRALIGASCNQITQIRDENAMLNSTNNYVPEIESVFVDLDPRRGSTDIFFSRLVFNLNSEAADRVRAIRIFRATLSNPVYTRPLATLSSHAIERLSSLKNNKNKDSVASYQRRLEENGIPNAITNLNPIDPYTNLRVGVGSSGSINIPPELVGQNRNFIFDQTLPPQLQHLDPSVSQNVSVIANLQRNPLFKFGETNIDDVVVGNMNSMTTLGEAQQAIVDASVSKSPNSVIDANNKLDFKEIAFLTPDKISSRKMGNRVEYSFDDETVMFGLGYKYFIVTIDAEMNQSTRSSIATIIVEGLRVPPRPSSVVPIVNQNSIVLTSIVEDQLVEKFEVYRKENNNDRTERIDATTISDDIGYTVSKQTRNLMDNGFLLIGESLNPLHEGSTFVDSDVRAGRKYDYRVYCVDIFGNKSESPYEIDAYVPDKEQRYLNLKKPTVNAEVDAATQKVKVTFNCEDEYVENLRLERRDLTIGQSAFTTPDSPSRIIIGLRPPLRRNSLLGERIFNQEQGVAWNGLFQNTQQQQTFIDFTVTYDHIYQYRIVGEDRYGNKTSYDVSAPVLVVRRPFINAPLNFSYSLQYTSDSGSIGAVTLNWSEANLDKAAEEMIGDQNELSATIVRTLYQIERKKSGEEIWQRFPLITGTTFIDATTVSSGVVAPNYRPAYLDVNVDYLYRIQAVQTGAFISNFTNPLSVFVGFPVADPSNFSLKTPNVYVKPFYVMLNWDTQEHTGIVDQWEIQRAEVNNIAAARLNLKNPNDFMNLKFEQFRKVCKESSRFVSKVQDGNDGEFNDSIITGQHYYMDTMIDFGNSYFYRIRAVSSTGETSKWVYKGIKITSAIFEAKWMPLLTDLEKQALSNSYSPMRFSHISRFLPSNTYSIQPDYSKSPSSRTEPKVPSYNEDGQK